MLSPGTLTCTMTFTFLGHFLHYSAPCYTNEHFGILFSAKRRTISSLQKHFSFRLGEIKVFILIRSVIALGNTDAGIARSLQNEPHWETETVLDHADNLHRWSNTHPVNDFNCLLSKATGNPMRQRGFFPFGKTRHKVLVPEITDPQTMHKQNTWMEDRS